MNTIKDKYVILSFEQELYSSNYLNHDKHVLLKFQATKNLEASLILNSLQDVANDLEQKIKIKLANELNKRFDGEFGFVDYKDLANTICKEFYLDHFEIFDRFGDLIAQARIEVLNLANTTFFDCLEKEKDLAEIVKNENRILQEKNLSLKKQISDQSEKINELTKTVAACQNELENVKESKPNTSTTSTASLEKFIKDELSRIEVQAMYDRDSNKPYGSRGWGV